MEKIASSLIKLSHVFPEYPFGNAQILMYCDLLSEIEPYKIVTACNEWAKTQKSFPKPKDLIALVS